MKNTNMVNTNTNTEVNTKIDVLANNIPGSTEQIKEIGERTYSKHWEVEMFRGKHKNFIHETFAVKFINVLYEGNDLIYLYRDLRQNQKKVELELHDYGVLGSGEIKAIYNHIEYLKEKKIFTEVENLEDCLLGLTSTTINIKEYSEKLFEYEINHSDLFASKSEDNYNPKLHKGVWLDTDRYIKKYDGVVLAIECDVVKDDIIECSDNKMYSQIKKGLAKENIFIPSNSSDGRIDITLGKSVTKKCLIFKLDRDKISEMQ